MSPIRVAIAGVGNCASSLIQGVHYYRDADPAGSVPGLMHVEFGGYHVRDIEFVAAFDVDAKKVGTDLSKAITASENNFDTLAENISKMTVSVSGGVTEKAWPRFATAVSVGPYRFKKVPFRITRRASSA